MRAEKKNWSSETKIHLQWMPTIWETIIGVQFHKRHFFFIHFENVTNWFFLSLSRSFFFFRLKFYITYCTVAKRLWPRRIMNKPDKRVKPIAPFNLSMGMHSTTVKMIKILIANLFRTLLIISFRFFSVTLRMAMEWVRAKEKAVKTMLSLSLYRCHWPFTL